MPFKKGQVANPKGRPKEVDTFLKVKSFSECATYARAKAYDAIDALVKNLRDESGSVRNQAAVALLDRAYGKAPQLVHIDGDVQHNIQIMGTVRVDGREISTGFDDLPAKIIDVPKNGSGYKLLENNETEEDERFKMPFVHRADTDQSDQDD